MLKCVRYALLLVPIITTMQIRTMDTHPTTPRVKKRFGYTFTKARSGSCPDVRSSRYIFQIAKNQNIENCSLHAHLKTAKNLNPAIISNILDAHPSAVNGADGQGNAPLNLACMRMEEKSVEIIKILRAAGASINHQNEWGHTPLITAVRNNLSLDHINALLCPIAGKAMADVNVQDGKGATALLYAARNVTEHEKMIASIHASDLEEKEKLHRENIHLFFRDQNEKIISLLLEHDANPNLATLDRRTPLLVAPLRYLIITKLLEHDANPDAQDIDGMTKLHHACLAKKDNIVHLLLTNKYCKANPNIQERKGRTPLHCVLLSEQEVTGERQAEERITELLLNAGANPALADKTEEPRTPLGIADTQEKNNIVSLMCSKLRIWNDRI